MKGVDTMTSAVQISPEVGMNQPRNTPTLTTLYDLIETVDGIVQPEESQLVSEIVIDMLIDCPSIRWRK